MISKYFVNLVNVVYLVNLVNLVNLTNEQECGSNRVNDKTKIHNIHNIHTLHSRELVNLGVNLGTQVVYRSVYDGLTTYPNAGYLSFLFDPAMLPGGQDHRKNAVKLARFMHGLGVKNGHKTPDNSLIMVIRDFGKNTYHNHEFNIPNFSHNIRCFQMINDLQRGFENADNFSLV